MHWARFDGQKQNRNSLEKVTFGFNTIASAVKTAYKLHTTHWNLFVCEKLFNEFDFLRWTLNRNEKWHVIKMQCINIHGIRCKMTPLIFFFNSRFKCTARSVKRLIKFINWWLFLLVVAVIILYLLFTVILFVSRSLSRFLLDYTTMYNCMMWFVGYSKKNWKTDRNGQAK